MEWQKKLRQIFNIQIFLKICQELLADSLFFKSDKNWFALYKPKEEVRGFIILSAFLSEFSSLPTRNQPFGWGQTAKNTLCYDQKNSKRR